MTALYLRSLVIAAAAAGAVFVPAANAGAQDRPAALLNNVEVRQLATRAEAADNGRLAAHFTALASIYAADAARHLAMNQSYAGSTARGIASGMAVHCRTLADLNNRSAATLRELAAYHATLAGGGAAVPPRDGARFQAGDGAPAPNDRELKALAAQASSPTQHRALEEYFLTLAMRYSAEATEHAALANAYRGTRLAQAAGHHDRLAALLRDEAKEATDAAAMHKSLSGAGR